jgi:TonB family protein
MVLVALALAAASAAGQTAPDPRTLLQAVADAAQAAKTWQVEGEIVTETQSEFASSSSRQPFRLFKDGPRVRCEVSGQDARTLVFDAGVLWEYAPNDHTFFRRDATSVPLPVPLYYSVQGLLPTAAMAGRDQVGSQACDAVRIELPGSVRTLCIDRERKLVLRDRTESLFPSGGGSTAGMVRTITFLAIQRDIPMDAALFRFEPPPGATERATPQLSSDVFRVGGGVTPPLLLSKIEPVYSDEALAAKVDGTVMLYIEVGPDGAARNIRVLHGLGYGLDEKAIEAVRQWRFRAGTRNGEPVTVAATIEVNFRRIFPPPQQ